MKHMQFGASLTGLMLLAGCSVSRGDCEFMLHTERERCLRANESNEAALRARAESKRKPEKRFEIPPKSEEDGGNAINDSIP